MGGILDFIPKESNYFSFRVTFENSHSNCSLLTAHCSFERHSPITLDYSFSFAFQLHIAHCSFERHSPITSDYSFSFAFQLLTAHCSLHNDPVPSRRSDRSHPIRKGIHPGRHRGIVTGINREFCRVRPRLRLVSEKVRLGV